MEDAHRNSVLCRVQAVEMSDKAYCFDSYFRVERNP